MTIFLVELFLNEVIIMTYYAQCKSVKNGVPQTPNNRYGGRAEMERQFHLYCAAAAINSNENDIDAVEWGTLEQGVLERRRWVNTAPTPEEEEPAEE